MLLTFIESFARFFASEIRKAASQMREEYQNDIMGKVAITIYRHHKGSPTTYKLCEEAQEYFDGILDNLASQFNSDYDIEDSITESQTQLDEQQRADIDVRTKAGELIGVFQQFYGSTTMVNDVKCHSYILKLISVKL